MRQENKKANIREISKRIAEKAMVFPLSLWGMLRKDYVLMTKRKKYLYLSILLPLIIGILYIMMLTSGTSGIKIVVCDLDNTSMTREALAGIKDLEVNILQDKNCEDSIPEKIRSGEYIFGIEIEKGFSNKIKNLKQGKITAYYDNSNPGISALAQWKIDAAFEPLEKEISASVTEEIKSKSSSASKNLNLIKTVFTTVSPDINSGITENINDNIESAEDEINRIEEIDNNYLSDPVNTIKKGAYGQFSRISIGFSPLFVVLSLFTIIMLCSTGVIYDRRSGIFTRLWASNSGSFAYLLSKILFFFMVTVIQFIIILLLFMVFGATLSITIPVLIIALIFISLTNTLIGFLIGIISDSEGVAVLISLVITLPAMFVSGMFYPVETMPPAVRALANLIPAGIETAMLKKAILIGGNIDPIMFLIPLIIAIISLYFMKRS